MSHSDNSYATDRTWSRAHGARFLLDRSALVVREEVWPPLPSSAGSGRRASLGHFGVALFWLVNARETMYD